MFNPVRKAAIRRLQPGLIGLHGGHELPPSISPPPPPPPPPPPHHPRPAALPNPLGFPHRVSLLGRIYSEEMKYDRHQDSDKVVGTNDTVRNTECRQGNLQGLRRCVFTGRL